MKTEERRYKMLLVPTDQIFSLAEALYVEMDANRAVVLPRLPMEALHDAQLRSVDYAGMRASWALIFYCDDWDIIPSHAEIPCIEGVPDIPPSVVVERNTDWKLVPAKA